MVALLLRVVVLITIHSLVMLLDLMTDVAWEVQVRLDAVSDRCEEMGWSLLWVVSINDDTSDKLCSVLVDEVGASISASELATVALRTVRIIPIKRSDGARDKTLATKDHLVHILSRAGHTCLIDEASCTLKAVLGNESVEAIKTLVKNLFV